MHALIAGVLILAQETEPVSEPEDIYPHLSELIIGAIAFFILFAFMAKWVFPRLNKVLDERRARIQGDLEKAEATRGEADKLLADYRARLASAREEANRIIEESRKTAEAMRKDMMAKAEQEHQALLGKAQEEIRAERDRVFQELRAQVGELSLALAGRMVGESLDRDRQLRLVDEYINDLSGMAQPNGNGKGGSRSGSGNGGDEDSPET